MKTFYSAEDIEALAAQGVRELRVDEDCVLTHLARDTAQRLGVALVSVGSGRRAASSPADSHRGSGPAGGLPAKPRGCQHGPLTGRSSGGDRSAGSSDGTVEELIGLVRKLADKGTKS